MTLSQQLAGCCLPGVFEEAKALEAQLAATVRDAQAQSIAAKHEYARAEELAARGRVIMRIVNAYLECGEGNGARSICLRIKSTWEAP